MNDVVSMGVIWSVSEDTEVYGRMVCVDCMGDPGGDPKTVGTLLEAGEAGWVLSLWT